MGENAGRLDVLTSGRTSTALARQDGAPGVLDLEQALLAAEKIATSGLVGRDLRNPAAVVRVGLKGQAMGIDFFEAVDVIDVIDKKPVPNAQCRLGHIRSRGHEAQFVAEECDREKATIRGRRREHRNDPKGWVTVVYTIEDAEESGLLDEWVERKYKLQGDQYDRTQKFALRRTETEYVPAQLGAALPEWAAKAIKDGMVKRRDNWWKNRKAMLRARATSTLYRMHFSDLIFAAGVEPYTAEELGRDQGSDVDDYHDPDDEQVYDGEIVVEPEQGEQPEDIGHATAAPRGSPASAEAAMQAEWDHRRRWVNAAMGKVGITDVDDRRATVLEATGGAVDSTGRLKEWQAEAVVDFCKRLPTAASSAAARDNADAEVVAASTAPAPPGPVAGEWRARAAEQGVTDGQLLIMARDVAGALGVTPPTTLKAVTDEVAAGVLERLG